MKKFGVGQQLVFFMALTVGVIVCACSLSYWMFDRFVDSSAAVTQASKKRLTRHYALIEELIRAQAALHQVDRGGAISNLFRHQTLARDLIAVSDGGAMQSDFDAFAAAQDAAARMVEAGQSASDHLDRADRHFAALLDELREKHQRAEAATHVALQENASEARTIMMWEFVNIGAVLTVFIVAGWRLKNRVRSQLVRISTTLADTSTELERNTLQVSAASSSLAEAASEQASSIQETGSSLEQISGMTRHNAENASVAKDLAHATRDAAETGMRDVLAMKAAMDATKQSSDGIAKIIRTIDDIAFQTNILALNAAIEAARAGEAGRGFAVVAEEIRGLAQRCAEAAHETADRIKDSISKSEQGARISAQVSASLEQILKKVREVDEVVAEIATACGEQNQGIELVNQAVSRIDRATQSSAANADESARTAEHLSAQAAELKRIVNDLLRLMHGDNIGTPLKQAPVPIPELSPNGRSTGLPVTATAVIQAGNGRRTDGLAHNGMH